MDKTKPPGISFDDIILKELVFSRKEGYSEKPELTVHLESSKSLSPEKDSLLYEMACEIKEKNESFYIKCTMIGFFSVIKEQENMELSEYSELNAPATIFPYIRETIASTSAKAKIPPVVIPPMNLNLLKRNQKE